MEREAELGGSGREQISKRKRREKRSSRARSRRVSPAAGQTRPQRSAREQQAAHV